MKLHDLSLQWCRRYGFYQNESTVGGDKISLSFVQFVSEFDGLIKYVPHSLL